MLQPGASEVGPTPVGQPGPAADRPAPSDHPSTPEAFISYARTDKELVRQLHGGLTARGRDLWVDWEDIHPSEAFMQAIERAIEAANVFVFVISPDSVRSTVCGHELKHAVAQGKKLVPVVCREVASDLVPPPLAALNWIFAREPDDLVMAVDALCQAFDTDLDWLRAHTRLVVRAVEWDRSKRNRSFLLHGIDLDQAERALAGTTAQRSPQPTSLQREYVLASRRRASARLRLLLAGVTAGLIIAAVLAVLAEMQRRQAVEARRRGLARQLAAQSELVRRPWGEPLTVSTLLAAQSLREYPSVEGDLAMRRALALLPRPLVHSMVTDSAETRQLSADGRRLAAALADGRIELLNTFTGQRIAQLKQTPATTLVWSRDGRYLLTGDGNSAMRVWSVERRDTIARFEIPGEPGPVAFSADGARMAFASAVSAEQDAAQQVIIRDLTANREMAPFKVTGSVKALALDSTGQRIVVLASTFMKTTIEVRRQPFQRVLAHRELDGRAEYPTVNTTGTLLAFVNPISHIGGGTSGKQEVVVESIEPSFVGEGIRLEASHLAHPCDVNRVQLSPEGERVVTTCEDQSVHVWMPSGKPVAQFAIPAPVVALAVGPEAQTVAVNARDGMTHLFEVPSARHVASIRHSDLRSLALSADGRYLTLLDDDGQVLVWEATAGAEAVHLTLPADARSLQFSPDDSTLAVCSDSSAFLFPVRRNAAGLPLAGSGNALGCAWAGGGSRFVTVSGSGVRGGAGPTETIGDDDIRIWDGVTGRQLTRRPRSIWTDFALSDNGLRIAIAQRDDSIVVSDAASGQVVRVLAIPMSDSTRLPTRDTTATSPRVTSLRFNAPGDHLAVIYDEHRAQVWDLTTGAASAIIDLGLRSYVTEVAPDGRQLVTSSLETLGSHERLWDALTGREITFPTPDARFNKVVFSPDSRRLATVTEERVVGIRDVAGLREISSFRLPEPVRALQFSPDGRYAATGSADQTARVWDGATGRELARMSFDFGVFDVSFNHRGDRLAVSGLGPDVFIESWRPEDLLNDAAKRTPRNLTLDEWQQYLPDEPCRPTFATLPDDCQPVAEDD